VRVGEQRHANPGLDVGLTFSPANS
jgi:hypothetical protein